MARKAAQGGAHSAAKTLPLNGSCIAISGKFPGTTQAALRGRVEALGATFAAAVTANTDLLIATEKDYASKSAKVEAAALHDVAIVTLEWLEQCETSGAKADEDLYLLSAKKNATESKKRAAPIDASPVGDTDTTRSKKQKTAESANAPNVQSAKSQKIVISVDEHCPLSNYQVYIDPSNGTIFDATLNQTNAQANNNKFYKIQLLSDSSGSTFKTWTRWGRVGEAGQSAILGGGSLDDAMKNFEKKFKDKSGLKWENRSDEPRVGKYAYVERSYDPNSDDDDKGAGEEMDGKGKEPVKTVECTLDQPTQDLMELIFNQLYFKTTMSVLNYDANKLPLGKLSKSVIARGFQALKDLSVFLNNTDEGSRGQILQLSNLYFSIIPHDFGRNRPPVIRDIEALKKEIELLESLSDMKDAAAILKATLQSDDGIHRLDKQFQGLDMKEMTVLDHNSQEFVEIVAYLNNTKGATHYVQYSVEDIFRIERNGEFDRFEQSPYAKIKSNRRLLWHGSRVTNFGGILRQGLRIAPPEAPVSGYMFGKGIYLADMSSKSANYCCSYNSGGTALLLLCEAELGDPMHQLTQASYTAGEDALAKGSYSTWGMGLTGPSKWKDASCVNPQLKGCIMPDVSIPAGDTNVPGASLFYNEYIVYDVAQVRLRYLLRVRM